MKFTGELARKVRAFVEEDAFDPTEHPRDGDGKFAVKASSGSAGRAKAKAKSVSKSKTKSKSKSSPAVAAGQAVAGRAKPLSAKEYDERANTFAASVPRELAEALGKYSDNGFWQTNDFLRNRSTDTGPLTTPAYLEKLDTAIASYQLDTDAVLYRGVDDVSFLGDLKIGDVVRDQGYMSTSAQETIARGFVGRSGNGALIKLVTPKGTKAAPMNGPGGSLQPASASEYEMLLARGSGARVLGFEQQTDEDGNVTRVIVMEYVPPSG